jgi:hypothetical protein
MPKAVKVYLASAIVLIIDSSSFTINPEHIRHVILTWQIKSFHTQRFTPEKFSYGEGGSAFVDVVSRHFSEGGACYGEDRGN